MPRIAWTRLLDEDPFNPELLAKTPSPDEPYAEVDAWLDRHRRSAWEHLLAEDPFLLTVI